MSNTPSYWPAANVPRGRGNLGTTNHQRSRGAGRHERLRRRLASARRPVPERQLSFLGAFRHEPEYPKDITLTASLYNLDKQIVASPTLRDLLESLNVPCMEYLPVNVYNHKGRPVDEPYVIAHPIEPIDCLDEAASGARRSRIDPDTIDKVKSLVIDESRIDPARLLFRPKAYHSVILAHRSLAAKVDAAGITGVRWIELSKWPE